MAILPDPALDDLTLVAASLFKTPAAYIGLLDDHRVLLKSRHGLAATEVDRKGSFEELAVLRSGVFAVLDAPADPRFQAHPWVTGSSRLRFYAAAPLVTIEGRAIGVLAVLDKQSHPWGAEAERALQALARLAMTRLQAPPPPRGEMERDLESALAYADGILEITHGPLLVLNGDLTIVKGNPPFYQMFELPPQATDGKPLDEILSDEKLLSMIEEVNRMGGSRRGVEWDHGTKPIRINLAKLDFRGFSVPLVVVAFERRRTTPGP